MKCNFVTATTNKFNKVRGRYSELSAGAVPQSSLGRRTESAVSAYRVVLMWINDVDDLSRWYADASKNQ